MVLNENVETNIQCIEYFGGMQLTVLTDIASKIIMQAYPKILINTFTFKCTNLYVGCSRAFFVLFALVEFRRRLLKLARYEVRLSNANSNCI